MYKHLHKRVYINEVYQWAKGMTYDMLRLDLLDKLGVLWPVDVCTERDVVDRKPTRDSVAFHSRNFFGFVDDILIEAI